MDSFLFTIYKISNYTAMRLYWKEKGKSIKTLRIDTLGWGKSRKYVLYCNDFKIRYAIFPIIFPGLIFISVCAHQKRRKYVLYIVHKKESILRNRL